MPDGKPDRHILPGNSYRSGLRAGRAIERSHAVEAFIELVKEKGLAQGDDAKALADRFSQLLREREGEA